MTERTLIETTNLRRTDQTTLDWKLIADLLAAPPPAATFPGCSAPLGRIAARISSGSAPAGMTATSIF